MSTILKDTYELGESLGAGSGGEAYKGIHLRLNKDIVVKKDKNPGGDEERLRHEVDMLKTLKHPHIPQVYDFIREGDDAYTVMEFIDGKDLKNLIKDDKPIAQRDIVKWALQLLDALSYLHAHRILHSDIKPDNIMRTQEGDICLIDFNVALVMGEDGKVRAYGTRGYASPEYYRRSSPADLYDARQSATTSSFSVLTSDGQLLDARSDIYALGATLYHLLTGRKPAVRAVDVVPISAFTDRNISPAFADIIQKAMNPDPALRYQSADEMLAAVRNLHRDDPRAKRHRRAMRATFAAITALLLVGGALTYVGLRQMERIQNAAALSERSARALRDGDPLQAVSLAMQALPERGPLDPPDSAAAQRALANALGVYDLSAGYKAHAAPSLPATPVNAGLSPDGRYAVALADNRFFVFDTDTGVQLAALPAEPSPLSSYAFRDPDTILYAGTDGLSAYSLTHNRLLWANGRPATAVTLSADASTVATVYKDAPEALICDAYSGDARQSVSFDGRRQRVATNEVFARSTGVLLALDAGGTWLAASFSDGSLSLFGLESGETLPLLSASEYTVFEGGFVRGLFAFAANRTDGASRLMLFRMDRRNAVEAANAVPMHAQIDSLGVCLSQATTLVRLDPETLQQTELAYTMSDIVSYARAGNLTLVQTYSGGCALFDENARQIADFTRDEPIDFAAVAGDYVLLANRDTPSLRILRSERRSDAHLFSYDSAYPHTQAHVLADRSTAMLISPDGFRILFPDGSARARMVLPSVEEMYKQEYKRDGASEYLDCVYNDGTVRRYSAVTGDMLSTESGPVPDLSMRQLFETDDYRVEFNYRETPEMRRRSDGKLIRMLELDGLVSEVIQLDDKLVIQYVSTNLENRYAVLVDADGQILADLPNLCDILPDRTLVFDDGLGNLRRGRLYALDELRSMGKTYKEARQ